MHQFTFNTAHCVVCECGAALNLASHCQDLGIKRVMLVTDPGIIGLGLHGPIISRLEQAGISVELYSEVEADPPEQVVLAAAEVARQANIEGVIGLGGGSSMDVAKLVSVLANSSQPLAEMYGIGNIRGQRLPLIQVPTTAGTGSEVTMVSIVTTGETTKTGVVSKQLLPDVAVLDAELTVGLPPHITAATGIDAMVHAIEAFTSKHQKNSYSDMLAREALRLMSSNIAEAVHNGSNLEARSNMLLGAMMAGQSFANSPVAAVHALAYPLGGHFHIPHGLSNSLVLPHVLRFNAPAASSLYAQLLGDIGGGSGGGSAEQKTGQFIERIVSLIEDVNLPVTLREMKISENELPMLAEDAMLQQRLLVNNPRDVSESDALAIYQAAY
jgi:alcohol dehydrogenase class IV